MLTFPHPEISKACVLERLEDHRKMDRIIKGDYWSAEGRGCAVGCTLESVRDCLQDLRIDHGAHRLYERYLGVPTILARLEDRIFEGLPIAEARAWPLRFLTAIPEGADLSVVWPRFAEWLLRQVVRPVVRPSSTAVLAAIDDVASLYDRWIAGDKPNYGEWVKVRRAADADDAYAAAYAAAAAAYAADAATGVGAAAVACAYDADDAYAAVACAYYAYTAYAAADAAAYAAAYAAEAATVAGVGARAKTYTRMADKLVELLAF